MDGVLSNKCALDKKGIGEWWLGFKANIHQNYSITIKIDPNLINNKQKPNHPNPSPNTPLSLHLNQSFPQSSLPNHSPHAPQTPLNPSLPSQILSNNSCPTLLNPSNTATTTKSA